MARAGYVVTVPEREVTVSGFTKSAYAVIGPDLGDSAYILDNEFTGAQAMPLTDITPAGLIIKGPQECYSPLLSQAVNWLSFVETASIDISWAYIPSVLCVTGWLDKLSIPEISAVTASLLTLNRTVTIAEDHPVLSNVLSTPEVISPNADTISDTLTISADISVEAQWRAEILNSSGISIKEFIGEANRIEAVWDGRDKSSSVVSDGIYTWRLTASVSDKESLPRAGRVEADTKGPLLKFYVPEAGAAITESQPIVATVSDPHLDNYVVEYASKSEPDNWTLIIKGGTEIIGNKIGIWDTKDLDPGDYLLRVRAFDAAGNFSVTEQEITKKVYAVDITAPSAELTYPEEGSVVGGDVNIRVTAEDNTEIYKVKFYLDGILLGQSDKPAALDTYQYTWDSRSAPNTAHSIYAVAYDNALNDTRTETVNITTENGMALNNLKVEPKTFSPDGDGINDEVLFTGNLNEPAGWRISITDTGGRIINAVSGHSDIIDTAWDGRNIDGEVVPNGIYTANVILTASGVVLAEVQLTAARQTIGLSPEIIIEQVAENELDRVKVEVFATISDADGDLKEYTVEYKRRDKTEWITIGEGAGEVFSSIVSSIDTSNLRNDVYQFRIRAVDLAGNQSVREYETSIAGRIKLGIFRITEMDVSIPMMGLPIVVSRTFDSTNKDRYSDFGYGWSLDIESVEVEEDSMRNVVLNMPDGTRRKFTFELRKADQYGLEYKAVWHAEDGVYDTLEMQGNNRLFLLCGLGLRWFAWPQMSYEMFKIPGYVLTRPDGTKYYIEREPGESDIVIDPYTGNYLWVPVSWSEPELKKIEDLNGNTLTFDGSRIIHSAGKNIKYVRDPEGRIVQILGPDDEILIEYGYDSVGDLKTVTRQTLTTTYFYDINHNLDSIEDPRGITPIVNEYDEDGNLTAHTDAFGNRIEYLHNPESKQEVVLDRAGNPTIYGYNDDGLVTEITNALGQVVSYTYDENGNKISETNALNQTTYYAYDDNGNMTSRTDPLLNTTYYTYNSFGQVLETTDALGKKTYNEYDERNNLIKSIDVLGNETNYTYGINGNLLTTIDAAGNTTTYEYDTNGYITKQTDAYNNVSEYTYDNMGNQLTSTVTRTIDGQDETITTTNQYDDMNRLIRTIDPYGSIAETVYNAIGKQQFTYDKNNNRTDYEYDAMGQMTRVTYADGAFEECTYDANG
ncbi:MAG: gliding motility-associated C-terminal domain-containing protein, partial [Planctomycetes bacterium]|nr:gliding motility-associated C-terminal domain-containing protein [Planctomycetota bacterium]